MKREKLTVRQLSAAVSEPVYLHTQLGHIDDIDNVKSVKLTTYLRAYDGVIGLEVFSVRHNRLGFLAAVDLPPGVIEALAKNVESTE